jgi:hypothetical protein
MTQRPLDHPPHRSEKDEPDHHPRPHRQQHLDHPVPQLPDVIHQGHPPLRILLTLGTDEMLAHNPRARKSTRHLGHQRLLP